MQKIGPQLLKKFFKGQCTPLEKEHVEQWLASDEYDESVDGNDFKGMDKEIIKDQMWEEIKPKEESIEKHSSFRRQFLKVAASVLIIMVSVYPLHKFLFTGSHNRDSITSVRYEVIQTMRGEKRKITLQDGTVIHLNANSELRVSTHFSDTSRTVYLYGEAHLQVTRDEARPFTIVTKHTSIRVLGTVFNVRVYPDEELTTVVVSEGKVRLSPDEGIPIVLTENQLAVYSSNDRKISRKNVYAAAYMAWKDNQLVFRDQSLKEIATILERWYDVQVEIKTPALEEHRFTGIYKNVELPGLMKDMSKAMQFEYQLDRDRLIIY